MPIGFVTKQKFIKVTGLIILITLINGTESLFKSKWYLMSRYHITVLQSLRTKLLCSHFFIFFFLKMVHQAASFNSRDLLSIWNLKQKLSHATNHTEKITSYMEGKTKKKGGKKKSVSSEYQSYFYRLKWAGLLCSVDKSFHSRKLSQYCTDTLLCSAPLLL